MKAKIPLKEEKGITLIALVITIIVLLILAGVTIASLSGQNGILGKASKAKEQTEIGNEKDQIQIGAMAALANDLGGEVKKDSKDCYFKAASVVGNDYKIDLLRLSLRNLIDYNIKSNSYYHYLVSALVERGGPAVA